MLELMNIYKTELKKLIVLYECARLEKLCLGPGCGRDDWTVVEEGGREAGREEGGGWKTAATDDL